jgi:hypothetical protein
VWDTVLLLQQFDFNLKKWSPRTVQNRGGMFTQVHILFSVIGEDIILTLTLCATGEHILSFAACMGNECIMTMLMDAGASTRVQDSRGMDQSAPSLSSFLPLFTKRFRKTEL